MQSIGMRTRSNSKCLLSRLTVTIGFPITRPSSTAAAAPARTPSAHSPPCPPAPRATFTRATADPPQQTPPATPSSTRGRRRMDEELEASTAGIGTTATAAYCLVASLRRPHGAATPVSPALIAILATLRERRPTSTTTDTVSSTVAPQNTPTPPSPGGEAGRRLLLRRRRDPPALLAATTSSRGRSGGR